MGFAFPRPCVRHGSLVYPDGAGCPQCSNTPRPPRPYDSAEYQRARRDLIEAEPYCHNPACPYEDAATPANPLTADHLVPVSWTRGEENGGGLTVLCRRCNSARGARPGAVRISGR